jgi:hypothetical protein
MKSTSQLMIPVKTEKNKGQKILPLLFPYFMFWILSRYQLKFRAFDSDLLGDEVCQFGQCLSY